MNTPEKLDELETMSMVMGWPWDDLDAACDKANPPPIPGPYFHALDRRGVDDCWDVLDKDGHSIASFYFWDDNDGKAERMEATFRLLAASPELVDALKALLAAVAGLPFTLFNGAFRKARLDARALITRTMGKA